MRSLTLGKSAQIGLILAFSCIVLANPDAEFTPAEKRDLAKVGILIPEVHVA